MSKSQGAALTVAAAAAVNNLEVLADCLQRSPDIAAGALKLTTFQNYPSASIAYSRALQEFDTDVVVFVHQDVYLPAGFLAGLREQLTRLEALDPNWAVAGVIGIKPSGDVAGQTWSTGLGRLVGEPVNSATQIVTLDEVILVVRRASGVTFDETMPGFHLYAADIVQTATSLGLRSYALHLPIIHHSRPVIRLDSAYHAAYHHMQRKWRAELPLPNLVCPIRRSKLLLFYRDARLRWRKLRQKTTAAVQDDPVAIARRLGLEPGD